MKEALVEAAVAAAFEDPRFVSISRKELDDLLVEISILSSPVEVAGNEKARLGAVNVPGDGLMIEYGHYSGLLLPIVAVEQKWGKKRFPRRDVQEGGTSRELLGAAEREALQVRDTGVHRGIPWRRCDRGKVLSRDCDILQKGS